MAETIFALASGAGRCGVAVVRLSGAAVPQVLRQMLPPAKASLLLARPRYMLHTPLLFPHSNSIDPVIDPAIQSAMIIDPSIMAVYFQEPASFTGEPVAELHLHGSPAILRSTLHALSRLPRLRMAGPGEFSRRALANGKIGLVGVEAVADLVGAETEEQRRAAVALMQSGETERVTAAWRQEIILVMAQMEAIIDFGEEDPTTIPSYTHMATAISDLHSRLSARLQADAHAEIIRSGLRIAITGPPNAGKSSLLNALAGRRAAIVSPVAGTTRDAVGVEVEVGGFPVKFIDTAGIREDSTDEIEAEGIAITKEWIKQADLILHLSHDGTFDLEADLPTDDPRIIRVHSKSDLTNDGRQDNSWECSTVDRKVFKRFHARLTTAIRSRFATHTSSSTPVLARARHRACIERACTYLKQAERSLQAGDVVVGAEGMRRAADAVGEVSGTGIDHEHVLSALFSTFCIGK